MKVKTLTGPNIQAALAEARRLLGDDVVLLESVPARDGQLARVTVLLDTPAQKLQSGDIQTQQVEPPGHSISAVSPALREARRLVERYSPTLATEADMPAEEPAIAYEGISVARGGYSTMRRSVHQAPSFPPEPGYLEERGTAVPAPTSPDIRKRGSLFTAREFSNVEMEEQSVAARMEAQLRLLNERLKQLESSFGETVIGTSMQWSAHPLFSFMLKKGLRPATAARLFDRLAAKGHTPDQDEEELRWALAQEVRNALDLAAPKHDSSALLLIGPSGAGKTSLALKLAKNVSFYGRRRTAVLFIQPEEEETYGYYTPIALYRHYGIPVKSVRTSDEMRQALDRVQQFDQIIIDTAPMSSQGQEARKMLSHVRRVTEAVVPLQVQLVVNATRVLDGLNPAFFKSLPVRPNTLSLTHLDEISDLGRIAEWLMSMAIPVRTVSISPRVPDGLAAFSPAWFVEAMMQS